MTIGYTKLMPSSSDFYAMLSSLFQQIARTPDVPPLIPLKRWPVSSHEQRPLEDLRRLTRGAMAEMRGLLVELRSLVLTDSELGDLLRELGDALTGRTSIPVAATVMGQDALPAEVQVAFYRPCQEGLNNIAKHAGASQPDHGAEIIVHWVATQKQESL